MTVGILQFFNKSFPLTCAPANRKDGSSESFPDPFGLSTQVLALLSVHFGPPPLSVCLPSNFGALWCEIVLV